MMAYSENHIALAAEYALGTLDAAERAEVEAMMAADRGFAGVVEAWDSKLGVLIQMVGSVEPRAQVWDRIKREINLSFARSSMVPPGMRTASDSVAAPTMIGPKSDAGHVVMFSRQVRRWRGVAAAASTLAAGLVAFVVLQAYRPELLPESIRPKSGLAQVAQVKSLAATASATPAQYVALLQKDGNSPAFILTVDFGSKNFTVRKIDAEAEANKSYELWLINDKLGAPRSLGVIGDKDFTARPILASYDTDTVKGATYAVTVEQIGGSPDGKPTTVPVYAGKLIETVPASGTNGSSAR